MRIPAPAARWALPLLFALGLAAPAASAQAVADLAVDKSGPALAAAGSNVTYTVTLTNFGPDDATSVVLTDPIPAGMTFVSATAASGFTCTTPAVGTGGVVSCSAATLAAGATPSFTFVFQIDPAAPPGSVFTNVASSSAPEDVSPENDSGVVTTFTPGAATADAGVTKIGPDEAGAGADVAYTIVVTNAGPDPALSFAMNDTLPGTLTFVSISQSGTPLTCTTPAAGAGGTVSCTSASFPAGGNTAITLTANIPAATAAGTSFTNVATVTTATSDSSPEDDAAATTVTVVNLARLTLDKVVVNNNGAGALATDWTLSASGPTPISGTKGQASITNANVLPGTYSLSESATPTGYTATGPYSCVVNANPPVVGNTLTLAQGEVATCTITNDDNAAVTYNGNGNTGGTAPVDASTYPSGATVTVAGAGSLVRAGFVFAGWNTAANGSGTARAAGSTFAIGAANVTLFAQWAPTFTVTYSGNGNTGGTAPVDPNLYPAGATVTVAGQGTLVKSGFTFVGWNTAANGSGTSHAGGTTFAMPAANVTLFAQWSALPTFTVTYSGNGNTGGTAPVDSNNYLTGSTVTVLGNTGNLVRTGFSFAGWNTAADGSGTARAPGSTFAMGAANVTLFAQWTSTFTVTYSGNGSTSGTPPVDGNAYASGATVTVLGNTGNLARTGFTFTGWNTAADGSGTARAPGSTFAMGAANVTLFAQWASTFTVTYSGNGSTSGTPPVDGNAYASGATVTVLGNTGNLARTGFTFGGWNTAANGSGTTYAPAATFVMGSANVTLFARWTAVTTASGPSPTGGGTITAGITSADPGCGFTSSQFIPVTGNASSPPAGSAPTNVTFPFGLFSFTVGGCTVPGAAVTVTVTYPSPIPAGAVYWKYGPTPASATPSWYILPATISGNTAVFTIVDGQLGDDDRTANGTIVDQGGPGVPGGGATAAQVPTLSEWAMMLLASLLLLAGMGAARRVPRRN
jgi:uncharacterized repeat protein (TIGR01451 family)/uncharacterized repeat protein (TIGR02543 family)